MADVKVKNSGNLQPDVEYIGFVLGAKTEKLVKTDGSTSYSLTLRLGSMIDPDAGWVDGNKIWINTELWLTPAAQAGTQKRIAEAFEIPIDKQDAAFFKEPNTLLYKKPCRFTTELHTYKNTSEIRVKWINHIEPPKRSMVADITDDDLSVILSRVAPSVDSAPDSFGGPELF
jgi:hypothetical protein